MARPEFGYVEFYVSGQAGGRVAREQGAVAAESSMRFTRESIASFDPTSVNITDGLTARELGAMLPFSQLAWKGSVTLDSELAGHALRELVAGDSGAIDFLTGNPSVGGKVELEMVFTTERMVALMVQLGFIRRDDNDDTRAEGPAQDAVDALRGLNITGFLEAIGAAVGNFGTFMWESVDKVKVDLHGDANHRTGGAIGGPGGSVTGRGALRLRAGYSAEYSRAQIERGLAAVRAFLQRSLPPALAGLLTA